MGIAEEIDKELESPNVIDPMRGSPSGPRNRPYDIAFLSLGLLYQNAAHTDIPSLKTPSS
jgi:hypothetical protein